MIIKMFVVILAVDQG